MMTIPRPILRYHGGKWRLAPWIIEHLPACRTYCEPYAGAASVLLRRARSKVEVLSDLSGDIVALFQVLRDDPSALELARRCRLTPYAFAEWEQAWEATDEPIERARRMLIRSWMSHGVGGSTTKRGHTGFRRCATGRQGGSHPAKDWASWPTAIEAVCERLRGVVIEQRPAIEVMQSYDGPDTVHYVDPPYPLGARSRPDHGYAHEMSDDDHRELAEVLHRLAGTVVLSGYPCDLYQDLYPDWRRVDRLARKDGGGQAIESIWINRRQSSPTLFDSMPNEHDQAAP